MAIFTSCVGSSWIFFSAWIYIKGKGQIKIKILKTHYFAFQGKNMWKMNFSIRSSHPITPILHWKYHIYIYQSVGPKSSEMYSADTENSSLLILNRIKLSSISFLLFSSLVHSDLGSSSLCSCYAEAAKSKHICLLHVTLLHIYYVLILIVWISEWKNANKL